MHINYSYKGSAFEDCPTSLSAMKKAPQARDEQLLGILASQDTGLAPAELTQLYQDLLSRLGTPQVPLMEGTVELLDITTELVTKQPAEMQVAEKQDVGIAA